VGLLAWTGAVVAAPSPSAADDPILTVPPLPTVPGLPIPPGVADALVPTFIGRPAKAKPRAHPRIPQNPYLAKNGRSSMHNDPYSSDAYRVKGPLGKGLQVRTASYGIRECATIAFDRRGRIVGLCGDLAGFSMMLINPRTLVSKHEIQLSKRDLASGSNPFTDICGGTYFFLDQRDRAYATTVDQTIAEVIVKPGGRLKRGRTWSLAKQLPANDCLVATTLDWDGRIWFFTQKGRVGTIDRRTGRTTVLALPRGEGIYNSVSADETGGVYVVTTHALYRLDVGKRRRPVVTWRQRYDRGTRLKPSMLSQGSGTSPTLLGKRWIAIADNADPRTHVIVYDRRKGVKKRRHCSVPVFAKRRGTTENSLVAAGDSFLIENNYGYDGIPSAMLGKTSTPGISRVLVRKHGCRVAWTNRSIAPSSVPKASLGAGLVYVYTKPGGPEDAWYVTAIDIRTGKTAWSRLTGTGVQWNNHYASFYLGPDGALYIATIAGLIRLKDKRK